MWKFESLKFIIVSIIKSDNSLIEYEDIKEINRDRDY